MKSHEQVRLCVILALLALAVSSGASQARGDEIVYTFSGTLLNLDETGSTPISGPFNFTQGEAFTGTISYNPETTAFSTSPNSNVFDDASARISITIGSTTFGESFLDQEGTPSNTQDVQYDNPTSGNPPTYINLFQTERDSSQLEGNLMSSLGLIVSFSNYASSPLNYLPSTGLPTALSLTELYGGFGINESVYDFSTGQYDSQDYINGTITNLAMVPEPSSLLMVALAIGITCVGSWTRRRHSPAD